MADIADGESTEVKGSGAKPYLLKNVGGVYSCSCPAWRNQSAPIERRTCKHLRKIRGEAAEKERLGGELPVRAKASGAKKDAPPILLAENWDEEINPKGWWISEKLDGVRAYWDGKRFLSRPGNVYHAPDWFIKGLPKTPLDGELWMDRQAFQKTISIVRRQDKSDHWKQIKYVVYDAPAQKGGFEDRVKHLTQLVAKLDLEHVEALEHIVCKSTPHLRKELARVEGLGGEGLMLREPKSKYVAGRSSTLLKVKTFHDDEAVVTGHSPGKGKNKGRLGALEVELTDGTAFSVGTGLSDKQRENPPAIGSVIMFRYQEMTDAGVPRFPSFVRAVTGEKAKTTLAKAKKKTTKKTTKKKQAKATKKAAAAAKPMPAGARYFELVDDKSSKFWEVGINGSEVTVRYGRIGTDGTSKTKDLGSESAAQKHLEKQISSKESKGYQEQ